MTPVEPAGGAPLAAALGCYLFWGLLPLLFQAASAAGASAWEIVGWRTVWSAPLALLLVLWTGRWGGFTALLGRPRTLAPLLLSALLIGTNWTTYVWAVDSGRTLSASLGYYLNPLLSMAAGALWFGERIDRGGLVAIALAAAGVALQGFALGQFPWVSLVLAVSFCAYGVVRKQASAEAQTGLLVECLILLAPALVYVIWLGGHGGRFGVSRNASLLLFFGGPATVGPLFAFAYAARNLPLTLMGFLQFITPTMVFFVGVEGGEPLTRLRLFSFAFIWAGVAVFAWNSWRGSRARRV